MHLFVYGTLKRGFKNYNFLKNAKFVDEAITLKKFIMLSFGSYPAIIEKEDSEFSSYVFGEVFEINKEILEKIDILEEVPNFYIRKQEKIKLLNFNKVISAWVYILNSKIVYPQNNLLIWK